MVMRNGSVNGKKLLNWGKSWYCGKTNLFLQEMAKVHLERDAEGCMRRFELQDIWAHKRQRVA